MNYEKNKEINTIAIKNKLGVYFQLNSDVMMEKITQVKESSY